MTTFLDLINEYKALSFDEREQRGDSLMEAMQDKSLLVTSDEEAQAMLKFASEHFPHGGSVAIVEAVAEHIEGDILLSGIGEIAKALDEPEHQAEYWLKNGSLPATKINGKWAVMRSIVQAFLKRGHA